MSGGVGDDFGFDTFRRAVCDRDEAAWETLIGRYGRLVQSWVWQHPLWAEAHESELDWVTCAFERFWLAVTPERFEQFATLPALLQYLKLCAYSVLVDDVRARRAVHYVPFDACNDTSYLGVADVAIEVERRLAQHDLWSAVARELPDPAERLVVYLSYARDMRPREIYEQIRHRFGTVGDVYRVKRNALDRLQRSATLRFLA